MAKTLSVTDVPYTGPYSALGSGKHKGKTAIALKRAMARLGFFVLPPGGMGALDDNFNPKLEVALDRWDAGKDGYGEGRWVKIRQARLRNGEYALDAVARKLIREEAARNKVFVPVLGPVFNGGKSVLKHDLTHGTRGLPELMNGKSLWPAFDDAYVAGTGVIAPEPLTVVGPASSASPGEAFYASGGSDIAYWFAHLDRAHPAGRVFDTGDFLGRVIATSQGGGPHVHVAINVEKIMGKGKYLIHHDNYTHGAPLIGDQLREWAETAS